jgi:hypothetical protein
MAAEEFKGIDEEYRNYAAYPLKRVEVLQGQYKTAGGCFIYHFINGDTLEQYLKGK